MVPMLSFQLIRRLSIRSSSCCVLYRMSCGGILFLPSSQWGQMVLVVPHASYGSYPIG